MDTVLVVDDESEIIELLELSLSRKGYKVLTASNGEDAFNLFKTNPQINLVLTDMRMNKGNGYELLVKVREGSNIPVIICTGFSDITEAQLDQCPPTLTLSKPINLGKLAQIVSEVIQESKKV